MREKGESQKNELNDLEVKNLSNKDKFILVITNIQTTQ